MQSTMQDFPLTVGMMFRHGRAVHEDSEVVTNDGGSSRRASFGDVADRAEQLAGAVRGLGVDVGDRVGTLAWNHQEHLEAYFAIPGVGAVLHTLNARLHPEQLSWIVRHAEDRVIIVDGSLVPVLASFAPELTTVEHYVVIGDADVSPLGGGRAAVHRYDDLLAAHAPGYRWPEIDERAAAAMCYTSGTTGDPKGVVYSHRSIVLHSFAIGLGGAGRYNDRDRMLPVVPMFHAMAWGKPYTAWLNGADLLLPGRNVGSEQLAAFIAAERPTFAAGVPTIWNDLLQYSKQHPVDLSSMREIHVGGAAVPQSLIEAYDECFGITILQAWGMTETSPLAALARPPKHVEAGSDDEMSYRTRTGRVIAGIELRVVDDHGIELPWDGTSIGEIQVRGPWVTGSYYRDATTDAFDGGWLRTGDIATVARGGYVQITDRTKDVIKSGGEWISSVELEGHLMAHDDVIEAAVIAVPDARWDERPLACVVAGGETDPTGLKQFLAGYVAKWQVPENWAFVDVIPKTSVGKFDKKALRTQYEKGDLAPLRV